MECPVGANTRPNETKKISKTIKPNHFQGLSIMAPQVVWSKATAPAPLGPCQLRQGMGNPRGGAQMGAGLVGVPRSSRDLRSCGTTLSECSPDPVHKDGADKTRETSRSFPMISTSAAKEAMRCFYSISDQGWHGPDPAQVAGVGSPCRICTLPRLCDDDTSLTPTPPGTRASHQTRPLHALRPHKARTDLPGSSSRAPRPGPSMASRPSEGTAELPSDCSSGCTSALVSSSVKVSHSL